MLKPIMSTPDAKGDMAYEEIPAEQIPAEDGVDEKLEDAVSVLRKMRDALYIMAKNPPLAAATMCNNHEDNDEVDDDDIEKYHLSPVSSEDKTRQAEQLQGLLAAVKAWYHLTRDKKDLKSLLEMNQALILLAEKIWEDTCYGNTDAVLLNSLTAMIMAFGKDTKGSYKTVKEHLKKQKIKE